MRLLIVGGSGFVGSSLVWKAAEQGYDVAYTYSHADKSLAARSFRVDLSNKDRELETVLAQEKPDAVIYCAVPGPSSDEALHYQVSVEGVARTLAVLEASTRFIYLSTNAVFSGLDGPYKEDVRPDAERCETPYKRYGVTKAAGERLTLERPNSLVVRTATVDGIDVWGKLSGRLEFLVSSLQKGKKLERFSDRFISPTLLSNLVDALLKMLEPTFDYGGVLHVAGSERLTDFDYTQGLARHLKIDEALVRQSSFEDVFGSSGCLQDTSLNTGLAQKVLATKLLGVRGQFEAIFKAQ